MNKDYETIRKDLYAIYVQLYPVFTDGKLKGFIDADLIGKFKYTPQQILEALTAEEGPEVVEQVEEVEKEKMEVMKITTKDELRNYYKNYLAKIFDTKTDAKTASKIEKSITIKELKYLYSILSPVPFKQRKKKDILYQFKYYFDNEVRMHEMIKKLN